MSVFLLYVLANANQLLDVTAILDTMQGWTCLQCDIQHYVNTI